MNLKTLGWAAYLAVSWTWCIGMFFPVLLVRDYGIWGFVVFAVPNVVGAAAMGWVLCRDGMSEHLVHRHRHAMVAFSAVTAAFHGYWLVWVSGFIREPLGGWVALLGLSFVVLMLAYIALTKIVGSKSSLLARPEPAVWIWIISVAIGVYLIATDQVRVIAELPSDSNEGSGSIAFLTLPMILGFALCPYLDLTFHHARQQQRKSEARWGFGIGFGVMFAAMILLTLGYSGWLSPWLLGSSFKVPALVAGAIFVHMVVQYVFTVVVHNDRATANKSPQVVIYALTVGTIIGFVGYWLRGHSVAGMTLGELVYRCFMVFYGLVFPAYVWLCMWPTRDGHSGIKGRDGRRNRLVLAGVIGLALPFYWMGFIERQEPWLVGGVAVVLLGRLFVGRSGVKTSGRAIAA